MDTQPYADRFFMAEWAKYVMNEYPNFMLIGEAWMGIPAMVSYYQGGNHNRDGYNSHFPSVFDFALYDDIGLAFRENHGWNTGVIRLYNTLAQDFLYHDPYNLVVFGDNHDTDRFFTRVGNDIDKLKMALTFVFTTRGIPQMYAGTELLESAYEHNGHGKMRTRFPGGWPDDPVNKFTTQGRNHQQNHIVDHITTLLDFRKNNPVMHYGRLLQFVPENNIYVYFRYNDNDTVMIIINNNNTDVDLEPDRFIEAWHGSSKAVELFTGKVFTNFNNWNIPANTSMVLQLN